MSHQRNPAFHLLICGVAVAAAATAGSIGAVPVVAADGPAVCSVRPQAPKVASKVLTATARARCPRGDAFSMIIVELERRSGRRWIHVGSDFRISRPGTALSARVRVPCGRTGRARYRTRAFTYALAGGKSRTRTRIAQATLRC